ncbi:hypothetical protein AB9K41_04660 [Cribrihabitans sp. XS_ASV171]
MPNLTRRSILSAAPVLACAPIAASAMPAMTMHEKIKHHAGELRRLLAETAPDGTHIDAVAVTRGQIVAGAFPQGWDETQDHFFYDADGARWRSVPGAKS